MPKIAIVGYGNLGKAVHIAVNNFPDLKLKYIFTRRDTSLIKSSDTEVLSYSDILDYKSEIDCLVMAGGSKNDLDIQVPKLASSFNLVDCYDLHHNGTKHRKIAENSAISGKKLSIVSSGWDPGWLSLIRLYSESFMPYAKTTTIWGRGVSQGHSDAIRRIKWVKYASEITVPKPSARLLALSGVSQKDKEIHRRVCYIVAEEGHEEYIEEKVRNMPDYFDGYDTEIYFITEEEFLQNHRTLPHKGEVISVGYTGKYEENRQRADFSIDLASNPEFTAGILLASARAAVRLYEEGNIGARTIFDIAPKYFYHSENCDSLL